MQAAFLHALIKAGTAILRSFIWHSSHLRFVLWSLEEAASVIPVTEWAGIHMRKSAQPDHMEAIEAFCALSAVPSPRSAPSACFVDREANFCTSCSKSSLGSPLLLILIRCVSLPIFSSLPVPYPHMRRKLFGNRSATLP